MRGAPVRAPRWVGAIPLSLSIAIGSLDLGGYHLQQISIIGIVIALGLLVDNAIVVTENISRLRQRGLEGVEAAVQGSGEIGWAIVSSTVTTVLAFLPIALLRTDSGIFMRSMPLAVIFALVASLGVSLTLTPYLSSRFLKAESSGRWRPPLRRLLTYIAQGPYRRTLAAALGRPKTVLGIAVLAFLSSLLVFPLVGSSLFPKADKPMFLVNVDLPENTGLDHTDAVAGQVEALLLAREEVQAETMSMEDFERAWLQLKPDCRSGAEQRARRDRHRQVPDLLCHVLDRVVREDLSDVVLVGEKFELRLNETLALYLTKLD